MCVAWTADQKEHCVRYSGNQMSESIDRCLDTLLPIKSAHTQYQWRRRID
jgi:hypothetical protein